MIPCSSSLMSEALCWEQQDRYITSDRRWRGSLFISFFFFVRSWQVVETGIRNGEKVRDQNGTYFWVPRRMTFHCFLTGWFWPPSWKPYELKNLKSYPTWINPTLSYSSLKTFLWRFFQCWFGVRCGMGWKMSFLLKIEKELSYD